MSAPRKRYRLVLSTPEEGAVLRLRAVLKALGRRFGFRCEQVTEVDSPVPPPETNEMHDGVVQDDRQ